MLACMVAPSRFRHEARGWLLRAFACATPSAVFAVTTGEATPAQIGGMFTGVVLFALAFTVGCSLPAVQATRAGRRSVKALGLAAWLKAAWGALGVGAYVDAMTGSWCLGLFRSYSSARDAGTVFVATVAVTLAQGAIIALEVAVLAAAVLGTRAMFVGRGPARGVAAQDEAQAMAQVL
jgi:hypothetical protein